MIAGRMGEGKVEVLKLKIQIRKRCGGLSIKSLS